MAKNRIYIPTFISSVNYAPARVLPHIYFYNGKKVSEQYFIQGYSNGNTASVISNPVDAFPYFDNYEGQDPQSGSRSLLFFNEPAVYGTTPTGSLYNDYWETYVSLLYNPRTRLVNCEAIIPLADYFKMELNDICEWRGNYYHLRAINQYNLSNGECQLQLLGPLFPPVISNLLPELDCGFAFTSSLTTTKLFTFEVSSSIDVPFTFINELFINLSGSAINLGTTQSLPADSDVLYSATSSIPDTVPFGINTKILSSSLSIGETLGAGTYYDVRITDTYNNGLSALSASYLGNGGTVRKQPQDWGVLGFWSGSSWSSLDRKVEIGLSVNRNLILYNMSGSNGFSSYNLAKPYLYSSGSIAKTIGITPVSQSIMQNGWGTVPAFNTDYTTRYQDNISARRFYIGEFNGNREIIRYEPATYNTLSNISVQRLDKIITQPILRKSNNNIGGTLIPQSPCAGSGSASGDLYYNFESSSFFTRADATDFFTLTYSRNYPGVLSYLNSNLTTEFLSYGAFTDVSGLELMQGNYTPSSTGNPFMVYQTDAGSFVVPRNAIAIGRDCT